MEATQVIVRPLMTEKSVAGAQREGRKKYCFQVAVSANKVEIRRAVEQLFPGAKVAKVNTVRVKGKRLGRIGFARRQRHPGKRADWKKAVVTLSEGAIPMFEGM
jgi:large subunit ribosomal protein L23